MSAVTAVATGGPEAADGKARAHRGMRSRRRSPARRGIRSSRRPRGSGILLFAGLAVLAAAGGCRESAPAREGARTGDLPRAGVAANPGVTSEPFGRLPDGRQVHRYLLRNGRGIELEALDYGGIVVALRLPGRDGAVADVVLGHDTIDGYLEASPYFGAIVGRYANRIAGAAFELDGRLYALAANDGAHHLHGGVRGFDKVLWRAQPFARGDAVGLALTYTSPDGEEGYPGTLQVRVTYTLTDAGELVLDYEASSDRPTIVNLSQHSYFNLAGGGDVLGQLLTINADAYTPVDETLIPTGEIAPVDGTPFDFRVATPIGARIDEPHTQLERAGGYDHNFVLVDGGDPRARSRPSPAGPLVFAARLEDPASGRFLELFTTEPGVQFYSGNFLDGTIRGKGGRVYGHRAGLCLETQHFPDSPHHPAFPSTVLRPGETYRSRTVYRFGVVER